MDRVLACSSSCVLARTCCCVCSSAPRSDRCCVSCSWRSWSSSRVSSFIRSSIAILSRDSFENWSYWFVSCCVSVVFCCCSCSHTVPIEPSSSIMLSSDDGFSALRCAIWFFSDATICSLLTLSFSISSPITSRSSLVAVVGTGDVPLSPLAPASDDWAPACEGEGDDAGSLTVTVTGQ